MVLRALLFLFFFLLLCDLVFAGDKQTLVVVACRVDDLTGGEGRHDPAMAAKGWRDLELHVEGGELQCKREIIPLEDAVQFSAKAPQDLIPLNPDFSNWAQCAQVGMMITPAWNEANKGWAVIAVGCPVPVVDEQGRVIDYVQPGCPSKYPGTDFPMRCRFDPSEI